MLNFLTSLYEGASGWLTLWVKQQKRTYWFSAEDLASAAKGAEALGKTADVYFGVGLRAERGGPAERGTNDDVVCIPGLWVDVDVAGGAHRPQTCRPTWTPSAAAAESSRRPDPD